MRRALTFIEILASAVIIALVFSGIIWIFIGVKKFLSRTEKLLLNLNYARGIIEQKYEPRFYEGISPTTYTESSWWGTNATVNITDEDIDSDGFNDAKLIEIDIE